MHNHPTADMVYDEVIKHYPGIGRATVYRILNSYLESGRAIRVPVYDGADRFDITTTPHNHARCRKCGSVEDIFSSPQLELPTESETDGFTVEGGAVMYYGLCRKCFENQ